MIVFDKMNSNQMDAAKRLRWWEFKINSEFSELPYVKIKNQVDNEGPPLEFKFINNYISHNVALHLDDEPVVGCSCPVCERKEDNQKGECCTDMAGTKFAYNKHGLLDLPPGNAIYECNNLCKCGNECSNRVVQRGQTLRLEIFRTSNGCGWGLRTLEDIKKGQFVIEYLGEIIDREEVLRREERFDYDSCSYLFNLDFNDMTSPYTVDATNYGNISRFINHSCMPNLEVYPVWINHLDPDLPRLAIFAIRNIDMGEELSFDYKMYKSKNNARKAGKKKKRSTSPDEGRTKCLCGTKNCRIYLN